MRWYPDRVFPFGVIVRLRDDIVKIGITGCHAKAVSQAGPAFQLDPARADFTRLHAEEGMFRIGIGGQDVLLRQLEPGKRDEAIEPLGLILNDDLILLACRRLKRIAEKVRADRGLEGFAVTEIRREADVKR
jgi:hypothetical protein